MDVYWVYVRCKVLDTGVTRNIVDVKELTPSDRHGHLHSNITAVV